MKVLFFSDIHSDLRALDRLMSIEADHYFAAGDLVNWAKGLDAVGEIMKRRAGRLSVIPGNHESESQIQAFCEKFGFAAVHRQMFEMGDYRLAALGYSTPTPFNTPGEYTEEQMEECLKPFAGISPLILVCHSPPLGTLLDRAGDGKHFGSRAIAGFLEANQPAYFFCGHVHEAAGTEVTLGKTHARNVGKIGHVLTI